MIREVNIITIEMITSVAESIPSLSTAKLPANRPITILETESMLFPMVLIHDVLINIFSLLAFIRIYIGRSYTTSLCVYCVAKDTDKIGIGHINGSIIMAAFNCMYSNFI